MIKITHRISISSFEMKDKSNSNFTNCIMYMAICSDVTNTVARVHSKAGWGFAPRQREGIIF